jgi:hypothetical protein
LKDYKWFFLGREHAHKLEYAMQEIGNQEISQLSIPKNDHMLLILAKYYLSTEMTINQVDKLNGNPFVLTFQDFESIDYQKVKFKNEFKNFYFYKKD